MLPILHLVFLADYLYSFAARSRSGFENIHVRVVSHLAVVHPPLVVFWQNVSCGADVEVFTLLSTLSLAVAP